MQCPTVERYIEMVGLLYDESDIKEKTVADYKEYMKALSEIQTLPPMATEVKPEVTIKGKKFKRITDINKMTGAQFITFSSLRGKNEMHMMLTALYINEDMSLMERATLIRKHENVGSAYPYLSFFLHYLTGLQTHFQAFSPTMKKTKAKPHLT